MAAYAATREDDTSFPPIFRFVIVPMFLFSGTFFPVDQMPLAFELAAYVTPIWHGVELCRAADARRRRAVGGRRAPRVPARVDGRRACWPHGYTYRQRLFK